jgi:CCR4-NOT transcription complex subunit 3
MEKFKAVEKEMKTKAYSKEGLSAAARLDPKEKEKVEACQFLSNMVEELDRQIEALEVESEAVQANMKKGKKETAKAEKIADIERLTEKHKWHQSKLELILRLLENGSLEIDQITDVRDEISYYVENNQEPDFQENDELYEGLNLSEEEEAFGMNNEFDRVSSQDTQSLQGDTDHDPRPNLVATKIKSASETSTTAARRPSTHMKSPLPTFVQPSISTTNVAGSLKPAPLPTRAAGETLKYASAAAAAKSSDKDMVGIAPLPPPPSSQQTSSGTQSSNAIAPTKLNGASPSLSHKETYGTNQKLQPSILSQEALLPKGSPSAAFAKTSVTAEIPSTAKTIAEKPESLFFFFFRGLISTDNSRQTYRQK